MCKNKLIAAMVLAGIFSAAAMADEPPKTIPMPGGKGVGVKVPPELDVNQIADAAMTLEKARELRKLADQGDPAATYQFATLLAYYLGGPGTLDDRRSKELRTLAGGTPASGWMMKAAEAGSQPAIEVVCKTGQDPLAAADLRNQGRARCEQLRAKHPAP